MKTEYSSNNSGGYWWLTDQNWIDLEKAGWKVDWKKERWLGALATSATREGLGLQDSVDEWERITGLDASDAGCPCCGQPHNFAEYDNDGNFVW